MFTSTQVLKLLQEMEKVPWGSDGWLDEVQCITKDWEPESPEEHAAYVEDLKLTRFFWKAVVTAKHQPTAELKDESVKAIIEKYATYSPGMSMDQFVDDFYTLLSLHRVPGLVERWKKLDTLGFLRLAGEKVREGMRQAIGCYLNGFAGAAVILCRAVLEFALVEAFMSRGGVWRAVLPSSEPGDGKKGYLEELIDRAQKAKILNEDLARKAHKIRIEGNACVHRSPSRELDALNLLKDTREILGQIYGSKDARKGQ